MSQHIPFTSYIHLGIADIHQADKKILRIHGMELHEGQAELNIIITGNLPELGIEYIETYKYRLPGDLQWCKYQGISVYGKFSASTQSEEWAGWSNFEGIVENKDDKT